jgi:hypothetical protein
LGANFAYVEEEEDDHRAKRFVKYYLGWKKGKIKKSKFFQ